MIASRCQDPLILQDDSVSIHDIVRCRRKTIAAKQRRNQVELQSSSTSHAGVCPEREKSAQSATTSKDGIISGQQLTRELLGRFFPSRV